MSDCMHINLVRVGNIEAEGNLWVCKACREIFTIGPVPPIKVSYGAPPKKNKP